MKNFRSLVYIVIIFFLPSCHYSKIEKDIDIALKLSGENRNELIKVLRTFESDTLKLNAAKFLIANMINIQDNYRHINDGYHPVIDSLFNMYYDSLFLLETHKQIEQLLTNKEIKNINDLQNSDLKTINSDFLIKHINTSFSTWENRPWSKQFTFEEFCYYILPYRQHYPRWEHAKEFFELRLKLLPDSILQSTNCFEVGKLVEQDIKYWYHGDWGDCFHKELIFTIALRSVGIPTAFECIPYWGNMNSGHHYFHKIIDQYNDTISKKITNKNTPFDTRHIIPGAYFDISNSLLEDKLDNLNNIVDPKYYITYNKTVPKVFRYCFERQNESLLSQITNKEYIPPFFMNDRLKDVTKDYLETATIAIDVSEDVNNEYAYLCVFVSGEWKAVHWGKINKGKAIFENMGKNILYLPIVYMNNKAMPVNNPFILTDDAKIKYIIPKPTNRSIILYRKYFTPTRVIDNASQCLGAKFQGANKNDLSDTITLYTISKIPLLKTEVAITNPRNFRFILFQYETITRVSLAEIELYGDDHNVICKGTEIGDLGLGKNGSSTLYDGDPLTFFKSDPKSLLTYTGIDLGKDNSKKISKIVFFPRNDGNYIEYNNMYELLYWDNKWISLGKKYGKENQPLVYSGVPEDALFWLKNHTKGNEERIFMYENGKQVWW